MKFSKRAFSAIMVGLLAFSMSFSGIGNVAAAADTELKHENTVETKQAKYDSPETYMAENANKNIVTDTKGKTVNAIKKDTEESSYNIRVKRLIVDKTKVPSDCTIDQVWSKYSDAMITQQTEIVQLYTTSDQPDYYIADLASSKINGLGSLYKDVAFVRGTDNGNPDVIGKEIKFDNKTGLAYIPKALAEKTDKDDLISAQVLCGGTAGEDMTKFDVEVVNPNSSSDLNKMTVQDDSYDITTTIPVTKSLRTARSLSLDDLTVYINGSNVAYDLTGEVELLQN